VAPRRRRSLLRRLLGARGAALITTGGVVSVPDVTQMRHERQRPASRPRTPTWGGRPSPKGQVRVPAVASSRRLAVLCGIVATALACAGLAWAEETPPPPTTTTAPDAPPPDPYAPPARAKPKAKAKPAPRRVAPAAPVRSYTPPAPVAPRQAVQTSRPKPQRKAKVVRKQRKQPARRESSSRQETVPLAPVAHVLAAVHIPLATDGDAKDPYLWLAGLAFAVLAVGGSGLVLLTMRFFRPGWE